MKQSVQQLARQWGSSTVKMCKRTKTKRASHYEAECLGWLLHCPAAWQCQGAGGEKPATSDPPSQLPAFPQAPQPTPVRPCPKRPGSRWRQGRTNTPAREHCKISQLWRQRLSVITARNMGEIEMGAMSSRIILLLIITFKWFKFAFSLYSLSVIHSPLTNKLLIFDVLRPGYSFYPVAIETLGAWGKDAQGLVAELGGRLAAVTGDPRSLAFLRQRLGIAMQRGNAAAIRGTLPHNDSLSSF